VMEISEEWIVSRRRWLSMDKNVEMYQADN